MNKNRPPRLCLSARTQTAAELAWPGYDPGQISIGAAHIGPGAFFRAHFATYMDDILCRDPRWGISAISLKTANLNEALEPQDGLYVLAELDHRVSYRIIGAIRETLVASHTPDRVAARLADPALRLVSLTITEKGYCLDGGGRLDLTHPDIAADLVPGAAPVSAIGWLIKGLGQRFIQGIKPFTVLSCDNLNNNGGKLRQALIDFASFRDPRLAEWIGDVVAVPCTMVDSITPATDDALRQRVADECNIFDAWPIQRESFRQFVIEDFGSSDLPDFSAVGAQITDKVHGYEAAKLRLLNGAHSTLAYVGILRNLETVHDAMQDHYLSGLIEAMMRFDIAPTLQPAAGLDLEIYSQDILNRFRNPAIRHLLSQIAWDGSKKLPIRLLDTIRDVLARGATIERLVIPIAAWMHFIRKRTNDLDALVDPLAEMLGTLARRTNGTAEIDVPMFLDIAQIFDPELAVHPEFQQQIIQAYRNLL